MKKILLISLAMVLLAGTAAAGTTTTKFELYKPGSSESGWGDEVNANFDILDGLHDAWALSPATPVYSTTTTFTIPGDFTATYTADRAVQVNLDGTYAYSKVSSSSYSAPDTTVILSDAILTSSLTQTFVGILDAATTKRAYPYNLAAKYMWDGTNTRSASATASANIIPIANASGVLSPAFGAVPVGTVIMHASSTVPSGYLECDGSAVSRTTYADLFAVISTTYGAGDGSTTFNLPDLRGEFVRGWDHSRGVDSGRTMGSYQADEYKAHTHASGINHGTTGAYGLIDSGTASSSSSWTSGSSGGAETRPRNRALMMIIKY